MPVGGCAPVHAGEFRAPSFAELMRQFTFYGYDDVGDRSSKSVATSAGTESTSYVYDTNDRLVTETLTTSTGSIVISAYTWDGNGNLKSKQTPSEYTGYVFDGENRLIEVKRGTSETTATSVAKYGYDADGQRVSKTNAAGTTQYLIDPMESWPQVALESRGTQRIAYVWGYELKQQQRGSQGTVTSAPSEDLVPLQGHLGTTIAAIDRSGAVVESYESSAFGDPANASAASPKVTHQYTAEYWDEDAKLTYLRARWYEPNSARLLSVDPLLGAVHNPKTLNRYVYAASDAVNFSDPSGAFAGTLMDSSISMDLMLSAELQGAAAAAGTNLVTQAMLARLALYVAASAVGVYELILIDNATKKKIEDCIESSKRGENKCKPDFAMFIVGDDYSEVRQHVGEAMEDTSPSMLTRRPSRGRWYSSYVGAGRPCSGASGTDCDEYPFGSTVEGGPEHYPDTVSLRSVSSSQNRGAGSKLRWFYSDCKIPSFDQRRKFKVLAIRGLPASGYVCSR